MSASQGTAPGWYPDPSDEHELRWFDGNRWTDHVASAPAVLVSTVLVVHRVPQVAFGFDLLDEAGTRVGSTFHAPTVRGAIDLSVLDPSARPVLRLRRAPLGTDPAVYVQRGDGVEVGRLVLDPLGGTTLRVLIESPAGLVGSLASTDRPPELLPVIDPQGEVVATLGKGTTGVAATAGPSDWVLERPDPIAEPLRALVTAAALAIDLLLAPALSSSGAPR